MFGRFWRGNKRGFLAGFLFSNVVVDGTATVDDDEALDLRFKEECCGGIIDTRFVVPKVDVGFSVLLLLMLLLMLTLLLSSSRTDGKPGSISAAVREEESLLFMMMEICLLCTCLG